MYKFKFLFAALLAVMAAPAAMAEEMVIFDDAVFYDGYQLGTIFDAELNDGLIRHSNSLYAKQLTDDQLDRVGDDLAIDVTLRALCDNYDRIANVNLSLVPKGQASYVPTENPMHFELARMITPFMDKNLPPDRASYHFRVGRVAHIMHDPKLRAAYDYYLELEVFGVPYSANSTVAGCQGRSDVFAGTLKLTSERPAAEAEGHTLIPLVFKRSEIYGGNFNNYSATDTVGRATKTYTFTLEQPLTDACITLVMSNHGAGSFGEEYRRRQHLVYLDGELHTVFTPGGVSCEPYRYLNTFPNGIYGNYPKDDDFWAENNNWCPGAPIPVRYLELGSLAAGEHKVMIRVPQAIFYNNAGDFPVSMYLQGVTSGQLTASVDGVVAPLPAAALTLSDGVLRITADRPAAELQLYALDGTPVYGLYNPSAEVDLRHLPCGIYVAVCTAADGSLSTLRIAL